MEDSSAVVRSALSGVVWPSHWTVVAPRHWREHCGVTWKEARGSTRYTKPDLVLEAASSIGVSGPMTIQSRGCGSPGDFISLPASFLSLHTNMTRQQMDSQARQLGHQFVKLRFGVFDEQGYPGDVLYPSHYKVNGQIYPTGATNQVVKGSWLGAGGEEGCAPDTQKCFFRADGDNSEVTCSLGQKSNLPSVTGYCKPEELALPLGPSKQTLLCGGRSILEVIEASQDWAAFNASRQRIQPSGEERIAKVDFVRAKTPRYVLILETSATMGETDDWKFINKAVQKLIRHDLPDSAEVGVVTFSNVSRVEALLTRVGGSRGRLADSVPDRYRLATDHGRCVLCGMNTALKDVLGEDKEGAVVVLVTQGDQDTLSLSDESVLQQMADYYQIAIHSILIPRQPAKFLTFYDTLSSVSGGRATLVTGEGPLERFREVTRALASVVESSLKEVVLHEQVVEVVGDNSVTEGSFLVDPSLGRETRFGIYVEDEEEHLVKAVSLVDISGKVHGPFTRVSTEYDSTNLKTLSFGLGETSPLSLPDHVGGNWRYKVEWHRARTGARQAVVVVTSRVRQEGGDFTMEMWANSDQSTDIVTAHHPLALYLRVGKGGRPVLGARVTIQAKLVNDNGTVEELTAFNLEDGGEGEPDLMAEDGVYSGFLGEYPGVGRYTFTALVEGGGKAVLPVGVEERPQALCCGQSTHLGAGKVERLGEWRRELANLLSINLLAVPEPGQDNRPPGRIVDLGARVEDDGRLVLGWTSPGGDWHTGRVAGYRLLKAGSVSALLRSEGSLLSKWSREEMAGLRTTHQLQLEAKDEELFLSLLAFDTAGNLGPLSNIVSVIVPGDKVEEAARTVEDKDGVGKVASEESQQEEWMMILALCGSFLLLALCLMAGVLYFLRCAGPRKVLSIGRGGGDGSTAEEGTDSSSTSSCTDPKNCSSHRLMPELLAELSSRNLEPRPFSAPPASLPDSTPSYWSASQLLTEHEQRALNSSYGPLPPLSPIREEGGSAFPGSSGDLGGVQDQSREVLEGLANPAFRVGHGTPVHGLLEPRTRVSAASNVSERSALSGISLLYKDGVEEDAAVEGLETPVRFSTAVQTVAPSTIATLRQNSTYMASIRSRSVSLV